MKIKLKFKNEEEARWIIGCAMHAIENRYEKDSVRYRQMRKHYTKLNEQVDKQLPEDGNIRPHMCKLDCVGPHCEGCRSFTPKKKYRK